MISVSKSPFAQILFIAALCIALLSTGSGVASAAAADVAEETSASNSNTQWTYLESGSTHRYTFTHHKSLDPDEISNVVVQLKSDVPNAFQFEVKRVDTLQSIGIGTQLSKVTKQTRDKFTHIWVGGTARQTLKIYIDVTNTSRFRSAYVMEIRGKDVSFPTYTKGLVASFTPNTPNKLASDSAGAQQQPQISQSQMSQPQISQPQISQPQISQPQISQPQLSRTGLRKIKKSGDENLGGSPENALPIDSTAWTMLQPGKTKWYMFAHDFDQHADSPDATTIQLETEGLNALGLAIMTSRMKVIGIGIPQVKMTGYAGDDSRIIWTSSTLISGQYLVEVNNDSQVPVRFNLSLK